jgi:hypothetical protein
MRLGRGGNDSAGTFYGRGRCREAKGNKDAAGADYRKALELFRQGGADFSEYQKLVDAKVRERLAALSASAPAAATR